MASLKGLRMVIINMKYWKFEAFEALEDSIVFVHGIHYDLQRCQTVWVGNDGIAGISILEDIWNYCL